MNNTPPNIGFVAIGRNEGERFKRCLQSLLKESNSIVYVDSGSSDDSVEYAKAAGAKVVLLGAEKPFTAARARNAGAAALVAQWPQTEYIMFMDGDCALIDGFAITAADALSSDPKIGVVTGQCLEQHPEASIYNRLCAMEWDGPVGEIKACGGIFMTRVGVFASVGGFNESIIAAEDDDFCIRVRNRGSRIVRIDHPMCLHDADMHRFGQWWRRMERAGHAFAQLGDMHGRYFQAERLRSWGWGFVLPALAFIGAPLTGGLSLLLLFLYPASFLRTRSGLIKRGRSQKDATLGAAFLTLAKFPNLLGMIRYRWRKIAGTGIGIIEYK